MTSSRVDKYLASLRRRAPVPIEAVEKSLVERGAPCFDSWLAMHEKYAGYVEFLGSGDYAVWGIVHQAPNWLDPLVADVDREIKEPTWYVTCADVHPSYVYSLDQEGHFFTPPAACFDVKVERNALIWEFFEHGGARRAKYAELRDQALLADIDLQIARGVLATIQEATDVNSAYFLGGRLLVSRDMGSGKIDQIWRRM